MIFKKMQRNDIVKNIQNNKYRISLMLKMYLDSWYERVNL